MHRTPIIQEAEERGATTIRGIHDGESLLELARSLGSPLQNADGGYVKELRVGSSKIARPFTLSATFGAGSFPLHTDTAFWPLPARLLLMRVVGDHRRPTTFCAFRAMLELAGAKLTNAMCKSMWALKTPAGSAYGEMTIRRDGKRLGFRYDRQCMTPANTAAREVDECIRSGILETAVQQMYWSDGVALVVANWQCLHGRGPEPPQELERILQRIYVG